MPGILIVEDDKDLRRGVAFSLEKEGYQIFTADTLQEGHRYLRQETIDLVLLDLNLPDGDGIEFCSQVRKDKSVPIIMVTAKDMEIDEVLGLESGADDYITKPFSLSVLKARISAALRFKQTAEDVLLNKLESNGICLYLENQKVTKEQKEVELSVTEIKLLTYFIMNKNQILLKDQILAAVWDKDGNFVDQNTLSVNIRRLRLKLEDDPSKPQILTTVHGIGYIWNERAK